MLNHSTIYFKKNVFSINKAEDDFNKLTTIDVLHLVVFCYQLLIMFNFLS